MSPWYQLMKMGALASLCALIAVQWLTPLTAAAIGVGALYLLFVRVG